MVEDADLYLAGMGFRGVDQMTVETRKVLESCRIVYHLTPHHAELAAINPNVVDMSDAYWTGEELGVVYERIFQMILKEVRHGPRVVSIGEGHPLFFDDCHMRLLQRCRRIKKKCIVLPAVSCLDTMCIDLRIDYAYPGLQVFEATTAVENGWVLSPHLHTFLLQVGEFGTTISPDHVEASKEMFKPLQDYLLRHYDASHRAIVCFTENAMHKKVQFSTRIEHLGGHWRQITTGTTLYLPPEV